MSETQSNSEQESNCNISHVEKAMLKAFNFLMMHNGAGKMEVSVKLLKRGQKEILIQCGRTYRFVVNAEETEAK